MFVFPHVKVKYLMFVKLVLFVVDLTWSCLIPVKKMQEIVEFRVIVIYLNYKPRCPKLGQSAGQDLGPVGFANRFLYPG